LSLFCCVVIAITANKYQVDGIRCMFSLQEKMKGKNKLVPRLLGITKKSIVRVDENTKEVNELNEIFF